MDDNKQHFMLRCNHRFHTECIIDSLRTNNECPICRDTNGNNKFMSKCYNDGFDNNDILNKKKICKSKIDDINNILKLMNDLILSNSDIKKLRNDIKIQVKILKKNTNNLNRNIKSFQNKLDSKYKDDIKKYLLSITSTEYFEKGVISKNIYKDKIAELHKILHKQIIEMGIPSSALESLKFNSIIKTQFEKHNDIYVDDYYNEIYNVINKNIKKVNNNIILTI
jgi:hypothetical protein